MKPITTIAFLFLMTVLIWPAVAPAQTNDYVVELKEKINRFKQQPDYLHDTSYLNTVNNLGYEYLASYPDSTLIILSGNAEQCHVSGYNVGEINAYILTGDALRIKGQNDKALGNYEKSYALAKVANDRNIPLILNRIGTVYLNEGNYPEALDRFYASRNAAEANHDNTLVAATLNNIAIIHLYQAKFSEAENDYEQQLTIARELKDTGRMCLALNGLGEVNLHQKKTVRALNHLTEAYHLASRIGDPSMLLNITLTTAEVYYETDSLQKSVSLFEDGLRLSKQMDDGSSICNALIGLAKARYKQGMFNEALANGLEGLQRANTMGQVQLMRDANEIVSNTYEALHDGSNALKYYKAYKVYSDSLNNIESQRAAASEKANYEFSKKENEFERKALQQQWIIISVVTALLLLAIILWLINRNRSRLNHSNKELQRKNNVIEMQKAKAEETLVKLQEAQAQLIQSEKMASLGELTAGIAHEIQNPLNFVNNFSEVNKELIDELLTEKAKGEREKNEESEIEILNDIKANGEKINHHGKRADAIVKSMLQHSRQTKGIKEPTYINALCIEYLRLSFHNLYAKDKQFTADFKTDFDEGMGTINTVSLDIGRALLNIFNNAFYTVDEKKKTAGENYQPLVTVTTKSISPADKHRDEVIITITDNGYGIPSTIIEKIFQPFFTTKPTGQGTGLGLSLAYDIITKEHGGTIKAESAEGEGTTFTICLPAS